MNALDGGTDEDDESRVLVGKKEKKDDESGELAGKGLAKLARLMSYGAPEVAHPAAHAVAALTGRKEGRRVTGERDGEGGKEGGRREEGREREGGHRVTGSCC